MKKTLSNLMWSTDYLNSVPLGYLHICRAFLQKILGGVGCFTPFAKSEFGNIIYFHQTRLYNFIDISVIHILDN